MNEVFIVFRDDGHSGSANWESVWSSKTGAIIEARRLAQERNDTIAKRLRARQNTVASVSTEESPAPVGPESVLFKTEVALRGPHGERRWRYYVKAAEVRQDVISDLADVVA